MDKGCVRKMEPQATRKTFFRLSDFVLYALILQTIPNPSFANRQFGTMGVLYIVFGLVLIAFPAALSLVLWAVGKTSRDRAQRWRRFAIRAVGLVLVTLAFLHATFVYQTINNYTEAWWWVVNLTSLGFQGLCLKHLC